MANTVRGHIKQLPSGSFRVHVYAWEAIPGLAGDEFRAPIRSELS